MMDVPGARTHYTAVRCDLNERYRYPAPSDFGLSATKFRIGVKFWGDRPLQTLRQQAMVAC